MKELSPSLDKHKHETQIGQEMARTRTTLRVAGLGGVREVRLGQLVFCLLERRRAKPERSPSSSSDVQGGAPLTAPRDDVACINS